MIRYILYTIVGVEMAAIITILCKILLLVYRECNPTQHVQHDASYQRSLQCERHQNILANLKETPYGG